MNNSLFGDLSARVVFDLFCGGGILYARAGVRQGHQACVGHVGTAQKIGERVLALEWLP